MDIAAGQRWRYRTAEGAHDSTIVIGAILTFGDGSRVVCCSVENAPQVRPDGSIVIGPIAFLPLSAEAFLASVTEPAGHGEPQAAFAETMQYWSEDPLGLSLFTVPFDGYLDRLIARQMSHVMGARSAA